MWFKNLAVFGISPRFKPDFSALQALTFLPATSSQMRSEGFSPVRDGELAYTLGQHTLLRYTVESKTIPTSAIEQLVADKAAALEQEQGFAPGKKARRELKERAMDELTPRALPSRSSVNVWLDLANHRLVIDSSSNPVIESVQRALIKLFDKIELQDVSWPRAAGITDWLDEEPYGFTLDDEVVLRYAGEKGKLVSYKSANMADEDVLQHVARGAKVESLAMTFGDRVSFVMTENAQLRRVRPLDILKDDAASAKDVDRFDNDFTLMTGELSGLISAVIAEA